MRALLTWLGLARPHARVVVRPPTWNGDAPRLPPLWVGQIAETSRTAVALQRLPLPEEPSR